MNKSSKLTLIPVMLCFFAMGFVDLVGIASNYVKEDLNLNDATANLFPSLVFFWFLIFSVPTGMLMNKIGRKRTVLLSLIVTAVSLLLPILGESFELMLVSFSLLGIGNALMQTSLNPLVSVVATGKHLASTLTFGQFVKAIASFLAPYIAMWGAIATIVSSLIPLICGILAFLFLKNSLKKASNAVGTFVASKEERRSIDALVFRQLLGCSRLGVLSTIYTDVVMLKKSKVGGLFKSYGIYKYVGKIEGGIPDLENCHFEVDTTTSCITVQLPKASIVSHEILKLEKFDEKSSSFCRIENSEVMDEIQQRKTDAEQLLLEYGFMQEVEKRAQEVISGMITALGYKGYDIAFRGFQEAIPAHQPENKHTENIE